MAVSGGGRSRAGRSDGAATRERLIAAAHDALREDGFAGASAREIARRAGCQQSQVFYYFGTVPDLLLAALDAVSARRLAAYEPLLAGDPGLPELIDAAGEVIATDLETGDVAVLAELISGARSVPGMSAQIAERLAPWQQFAERAARQALAAHPLGGFAPAGDLARLLVAGILGLELLATLDSDGEAVAGLVDRASAAAAFLAQQTAVEVPR